jgi:glucokinase
VSTLSIGIDIGGTKILGGVVDSTGNILMTHREETPKAGGSELIDAIIEVIRQLLNHYPAVCVGLSAAGFVSVDRSTMLASPNIAHWSHINLRSIIMDAIQLPVIVENDANAAAWGEAKFGAGRGELDVMMITVGTGIGGGLVTRGELFRGSSGVAAEFGHMRVFPNGLPCGCGAYGCFEKYASGTALMEFVKSSAARNPRSAERIFAFGDGTLHGLRGTHITLAAQSGDALAISAFEEIADWLGAGIASLAVSIDPACVVIGGGVIEAGELLMKPMLESFRRNMPFVNDHPAPKFYLAQLGNDAGVVGAADLARI